MRAITELSPRAANQIETAAPRDRKVRLRSKGSKVMDTVGDQSALVAALPDRDARRFIVVANRTGGQGKTVVAHLLSMLLRQADPGFRVMCADSVEMVGPGLVGVSKLGRSVPGVIEVGSGPSPSQVLANPNLALEYWDAIGGPLLDKSRSGCLLDVGANVVDQIMDWARAADLREVFDGRVVTDLVIPVVASAKSLADASEIAAAAVLEGGLPIRTVSVVENAWQGPFTAFASNPDYIALLAVVRASGGSVASLPKCLSEILGRAERAHLGIADVLEWDYARIADRFEWALIKASREVSIFSKWVAEASASLSAAGLADPFPSRSGAHHGTGTIRDARPV